MEKTSEQMYSDLLLQLGRPTIVEPDVLVGYLRDVERMQSMGHITEWQLQRARDAYGATLRRDPRQGGSIEPVSGDLHRDPLTGAPGAHPVGTGVGAAAGGAVAGAVVGSVAGPVGTLVGVAVGAVVGGLAGKGLSELIDPTAEQTYWRHNYASRPYVAAGATYDDYGPAYELGVTAHRDHASASFDDLEPRLSHDWDRVRGTSALSWDAARPATRDAWVRVGQPR